MPTIQKSIELDAPVERIYDMWTRFEQFPSYMEHVEEVRRTGRDTTHWRVRAAGRTLEWDARVMTEPNRRVAWRSVGESGQDGEVTFTRLGDRRTRMDVRFDYRLPSRVEDAASKGLGIADHVVTEDLENFKRLVEEEERF